MGVDERTVTVTENPVSPAAAVSTSENTLTGTARLEKLLIMVDQFPFCTCDRDAG